MSLSELARSRAVEPNRTRSRRSGITSGRSARRCRMSSAVAATVMRSQYRSGVRGVKGTILLMMRAGAQGKGGGTTSTQSPTSSELALDDPREGLEWLSPREQLAVDEESGRVRHAETNRLVHALLHCGRMGPAREAALEARELQPHLLGIRPELLGTGLGRVSEERVVILPELPLIVGAPRRLGCVPSLGMETVDRKVPVHELHLLAVAGQNPSQRRDDSLAERTVKVRERDDCHRRRGWPPERGSLDPNLGPERRRLLKTDHHGGLRA